MYYMALLLLRALSIGRCASSAMSPLGLVFVGIRENEERMRADRLCDARLQAPVLHDRRGAFAGFAGGLYAIFNGFISPDAVYWSASGDVLIMAMLGGTGTLIGPAIGARRVPADEESRQLLHASIGRSSSASIFIACVLYLPERHLGRGAPLAPGGARR